MGSFLPKKGRFFKTLRGSYAALRAAGATASPCDAWGYVPLPRRWGNGAAMRRLRLLDRNRLQSVAIDSTAFDRDRLQSARARPGPLREGAAALAAGEYTGE